MNPALVLFARFPRLGRVKTRLEPLLGRENSLRLFTAFLWDTLERTSRLPFPRLLYLSDCSESDIREFELTDEAAVGVLFRLQRGRDLGERLLNACQELEGLWRPLVFLGTDTPHLPLRYIEEAVKRLAAVPVTIGPVEDGGYYLLGLRECRCSLFTGIDWGSDLVLRQTLDRLREDEYHLLPPFFDIDTPEDLQSLVRLLASNETAVPRRTCDFLRSVGLI